MSWKHIRLNILLLRLLVPSWRENHIEPLDEEPSFVPPEVRQTWREHPKNPPADRGFKTLISSRVFFQLLEDNVYLKRHMKLELDEKRRKRLQTSPRRSNRNATSWVGFVGGSKLSSSCFWILRWDIQRIREQRMFQRLQQRMNRKKVITEAEPELSSFYPDTEDGSCTPLPLQLLLASRRF